MKKNMTMCTIKVKELVVVVLFTNNQHRNQHKDSAHECCGNWLLLAKLISQIVHKRRNKFGLYIDSPRHGIASKTEVCWSLDVVLPAHWRGANSHLGGGTATNATSSHACRCFFSQRQPGNPTPQEVVDLKALSSSSATDKATPPTNFLVLHRRLRLYLHRLAPPSS